MPNFIATHSVVVQTFPSKPQMSECHGRRMVTGNATWQHGLPTLLVKFQLYRLSLP